jgi:cytidine deaminase
VTESERLIALAKDARRGSYSPYSEFAVGAALVGTDDRIWSGANVENASYGLSMCAERTAIFHAVANGATTFRAVAVAGPDGVTTLPCGACRQVLWEFAPSLTVVYEDSGATKEIALAELLPEAFGPAQIAAADARGARV